jgi:hypothetical protein
LFYFSNAAIAQFRFLFYCAIMLLVDHHDEMKAGKGVWGSTPYPQLEVRYTR